MSERLRPRQEAAAGHAWFSEEPRFGFAQSIEVRSSLWSGQSDYQRIEMLDTVPFGRALVLDGAVQTTASDEFCYHELLVHIPLLAHPAPKSVLVIGGGDGGCLRHVLMHGVDRAVQVEIDQLVVRACAEWMPGLAGEAFADPRAELVIGDGFAFLEQTTERFDAIIVDSTDPVGPAVELISERFFGLARGALSPEGVFVIQSGSPLLMNEEMRLVSHRVAAVFPQAATYLGYVPAYPGALWSFAVGSNAHDPAVPRRSPPGGCRYYTPAVHRAAFALPAFLADSLVPGRELPRAHGATVRGLLG
ncbi:MAG: polyamine aminopropyltransferase [Chloroflexota bacterium]